MNTQSNSRCRLVAFGCLIAVSAVGCSGSDQSSGPGAGGSTDSAGAPGIGGLSTIGGVTGSGGTTATAGAPSTGGNSSIGGSTVASGGNATGGGTTLGGNTGGTAATGGAPSSSSSATGGTIATGGSRAASGGNSTGGVNATGGAALIGGSSASGGTKATGGVMATGGVTATGGKATGGAATGGTAASVGGSGGASNCTTPPAQSTLVGWAAVSGNGVSTTTGGGNATPMTVSTLAALNTAASGSTAAVIFVTGVLAAGTVNIGSNKTIIGLCGAELHGTVNFNGSVNVIFRNIKVVGYNCSDSSADCSAGADAIHVTAQAHHLWFDHDDISDGSDGNLDINQASDFITVSWTKFHYSSARTDPVAGASGHRYSNLIGAADNTASDVGFLNTTFHHNWWADNVDQRMPRARYGKIHVFNNLYTTTGNNYCVGVGADASVRVENNAFIGVTRPVNSSSTGFANANTTLTIAGNILTNTSGTNAVDIGTAFTPTYAFAMDAASAVESAVRAGAGPK